MNLADVVGQLQKLSEAVERDSKILARCPVLKVTIVFDDLFTLTIEPNGNDRTKEKGGQS